ncbi:PKD domain-containing protein, partial [Thermoplasmatales archaeon AK]|nr:PKD domain-containing protein [Thermoplasmatales archaeon AK]
MAVEPLPKITVSESLDPTDAGIPVEFNSSVSGGTPFYNYSWYIAGYGYVGYQKDLAYIFSQPGYYNVTVRVTDGSGNSASASILARVNGLPSVTIHAEYPNIDPNVTDSFSANVTGGTPSFNYTWYVSGSPAGNGNSLAYSFPSPGVYVVRITVTDSLGQSASYVTDITVAAYPNASIIASSTDLDANVSDQFRASGFGGIGPYGYEWIIAGHEFGNSTVSYAFRTPGNYSVQLIISDSFGKDASTSMTVDVRPDPTVSVSWSGKPVV